jgi:hypothetical protein
MRGDRLTVDLAIKQGIKMAAEFAGTFDKQIDHPYRFEDVILHKFNLRKRKPRKKRPA